jgi:hypothetical protein
VQNATSQTTFPNATRAIARFAALLCPIGWLKRAE